MGDHRASIKCEFSMHDIEAKQDWWINQDTTGCDRRIVEWFDRQVALAMSLYNAKMFDAWEKENAANMEKAEREELARLQAKYQGQH